MLTKASDERKNPHRSSRKTEPAKIKRRASEPETLLQKNYEDKVLGSTAEGRFV